jgi:hypothetical protein
MVAGISGATPGSGAGVGFDENDGRLMLLHAPRNIDNAETIPRLATVRALRDLIIESPDTDRRSVPQPSAKPLSEQRCPASYAERPDLVSRSILY